MKFKITDWITDGDISPLKWGDSAKEICQLFANSFKEINSLKERNFPYIVLDFVEFYFTDNTNFIDLYEIVIKPISLYKPLRTKFIDPGWLSSELSFKVVSAKLNELNVSWQVERGSHYNTPNIRTQSGQFFAFDPDREKDDEAELMKIYLRR